MCPLEKAVSISNFGLLLRNSVKMFLYKLEIISTNILVWNFLKRKSCVSQ